MELEQLRLFIAAAEAGSFSAGARKLYISHSTLSRSMAALENELGVKLFERSSNATLGITSQGEYLLAGARQLLSAAEELKTEIKKIEG